MKPTFGKGKPFESKKPAKGEAAKAAPKAGAKKAPFGKKPKGK